MLRGLPPDAFARLRPDLLRVQIKRQQLLKAAHRLTDGVSFIEHGMAILLARTKRDGQIGVATIGRAGLAGVPVVLGTMRSPHRCLVQVPGEALQIGSKDLRRAMDESPLLRQLLMNYT